MGDIHVTDQLNTFVHYRFVAAPVTLECERKYNAVVSYVNLDVSLGTVELLECLFERHNSELLMSVAGTPDPRPPTPNHIEVSAQCDFSFNIHQLYL